MGERRRPGATTAARRAARRRGVPPPRQTRISVCTSGTTSRPPRPSSSSRHAEPATLYLCAIKDLYAGRIVGYSMAGRMQASLAVDALHQAVARRGGTSVVAGCVVHSDRGSQFRSNLFQDALTRHGLLGSIGQVGSAGDNAVVESFFALLQKNVLDRRQWATRQELRTAIVTWIEKTYHRRRRQDRLGRLTPVEYEMILDPTRAHAA